MQQFPERILKTFFMRRHFVSECQRVCVRESECVCVCVDGAKFYLTCV